MANFISPQVKLFSHLLTLDAIKRGERPAPVNVELFLSNRCGHGCQWCHYAYTHTRGPLAGKVDKPQGAIPSGDLMDEQLAVQIIAQLREAGVKSLTFSGGGEPTQHPYFDGIISNAVWQGLEVGLYTHGGNLNPERAALLKEMATWVYISLDECTAEAFKERKGVNRFDKVIEGICNLVKAEGNATIGLGFLLHKDNWRDTHKMVSLARSLRVNYVQFRPTVLYAQDNPGEPAENTAWISNAVAHLGAYQMDKFVIADLDRFKMYRDWDGHGYQTCYGSALQTVISPNGMVWRCTNKTEHPSALLGDLTQESFAELWARSGGACQVDGECRLLCRQHISNLSLQTIMAEAPHSNFI